MGCKGTNLGKSPNFSIWLNNQTGSTLRPAGYRGDEWSQTRDSTFTIPFQTSHKVGVFAKRGDGNGQWGWLYFEFADGPYEGRKIQAYFRYRFYSEEEGYWDASIGWYNADSTKDHPQPDGELGLCGMSATQELVTFYPMITKP
ncbi:MAG: hypothetical protein ABSF28_25235 [Terracidiphilus sp.]